MMVLEPNFLGFLSRIILVYG